MGQIVRRKKKGRPSNTDPARRHSSTAPPSPVDQRRSRRCRNVRYNFDIDDYVDDEEFYDEEDEDVRRRQKKLRLLLCEDDSRSNRRVPHAPASSSSDDYDEDDDDKPSKKRKLHGVDEVDDEDNRIEEIRGRRRLEEEEEEDEDDEEDEKAGGADIIRGIAPDHPKGVPLPDKKTLELILDKLQKKDIYGVYAEPVDPEELPDYYDVIKHPMDFATVRKKLAKGSYLTLKQFESDVLLICTNAMQYNAPDTIYYKQASSIQEQAKLRFQRLRANVDRSDVEVKPEQKTMPSFSLPKKQLRKPVVRTMQDPVGSETFSGPDHAGPCLDFQNGSPAQTTLVRPNSVEGLAAENSSLADNNLDKGEELVSGKGFISKLGRRPSVNDENRRATYNICTQPVTESESIFSIFEDESKQFIPVGLQADYSYARSLARFAATLGSVAWKVASKTIEQALPEGVKFGRGWVGEYEPLPTPVLLPRNFNPKEPKSLITCDARNVKKDAAPKMAVKQESFKEASKDMRPPFFSSFRVDPSEFAGSNLKRHKNVTEREKEGSRQVKLNHLPPTHVSAADFVAPKPVLQNRNIVSSASFKHPNSSSSSNNNDGFAPGRPSKGKPTSVSLNCNNSPYRQDQQMGLSDPVQMMKMLAEKAQPGSGSGSGSPFGPKREDSHLINPNGSQSAPKREDSNNVALTAAQSWMSLGGSGGFMNPPNAARDRLQPQVSRFRGEFPVQAFVPQPVRMTNESQFQNQNRNMGYPQLATADLSRFQVQSGWRGVPPQMQPQSRPKQQESRPPDLNIGYQSMGSPVRQSTGMMVDSQQPDLALQL